MSEAVARVLLFSAALVMPGCTRSHPGPTSNAVRNMDNKQAGATLVPERIEVDDDGALIGRFRLTTADHPVELSGFFGFPPKDGNLDPHFVEYQVMEADGWRSLDIGYDGIPERYRIRANTQLTLEVRLGVFSHQGIDEEAHVRIGVSDIYSDPFRLSDAKGTANWN